jgi:hypothetical protein
VHLRIGTAVELAAQGLAVLGQDQVVLAPALVELRPVGEVVAHHPELGTSVRTGDHGLAPTGVGDQPHLGPGHRLALVQGPEGDGFARDGAAVEILVRLAFAYQLEGHPGRDPGRYPRLGEAPVVAVGAAVHEHFRLHHPGLQGSVADLATQEIGVVKTLLRTLEADATARLRAEGLRRQRVPFRTLRHHRAGRHGHVGRAGGIVAGAQPQPLGIDPAAAPLNQPAMGPAGLFRPFGGGREIGEPERFGGRREGGEQQQVQQQQGAAEFEHGRRLQGCMNRAAPLLRPAISNRRLSKDHASLQATDSWRDKHSGTGTTCVISHTEKR